MATTARRLEQSVDRQHNIEKLRNQLDSCITVPVQVRNVVEEFLIWNDIFSIEEIQADTTKQFAEYLKEHNIQNKAKVKTYLYALTKYKEEYRQKQFKDLLTEAEGCSIEKPIKRKAVNFLMDNGIVCLKLTVK